MTNQNDASKTSDEEEFVERLEKGSLAYISESGPVYNGPTWAESKAAEIIKRLVAERDDLRTTARLLLGWKTRAEAAENRTAELGAQYQQAMKAFDKWAMEAITFTMSDFRRAQEARDALERK